MVENEANVVGMLQMKSNSKEFEKNGDSEQKSHLLSVAPCWLLEQ